MPPPDNAHAALIEELYDILSEQLQKESCRVRTTAYGLGIRTEPALAVRNPDLTVFDRGELKTARGYVWTAPHLVVECLSPSNRKGSIHQLLVDYESAQVREVWLLNPATRTAEKYTLENGLYRGVEVFHNEELEASSVPAKVSLERLWSAFEAGR
jgi:Uma2 family endonuclease